jgi:hypothetical protein
MMGKSKTIPLHAWTGPEGSRKLWLSDFNHSEHDGGKVVNHMHRPPLPTRNIHAIHFCESLSQPQGHSAAGRIMSMKKSKNTIGNQTRDLPACIAVPQPTAPPRAPQ